MGLSRAQQDEVWVRWRTGISLRAVAREMNLGPAPVRVYVQSVGGKQPAPRVRSPKALSALEREEISRGLAGGRSFRAIAVQLGRNHTTIGREVARNGGRDRYRAELAKRRALERGCRPKHAKLRSNARLRAVVEEKLGVKWSPRQISNWLRLQYPDDAEMQISHETIYMSLFVQSRGALRRELAKQLRTGRMTRKPVGQKKSGQGRGQINGQINISQRPAEIEDRAAPGHWEGDLVMGNVPSAIATLVERQTRYVQLVRLPAGYKAEPVRDALIQSIQRLPTHLRKSLTWDQGKEMAHHLQFSVATGVDVYFCDPHSPWQRGSNENTNGLLRQYFPKRHFDFTNVTQEELDNVAAELNGRPRETLGWKTPAQMLAALIPVPCGPGR
ncbi:IS30 family transposase [Patulibacter minatonensis]|uniref:IS30 family transposase n=1 Tax=Patulibacter minatonensis TaxID=298163 RepID=UPI000569ECA1|nr:IS30 family transposase [Patulibacter minatonensis]